MGTRSKTVIFDEDGKPLVALYRQFDGYFEGHGAELAQFLKDMVMTNGISGLAKSANGMGCLAAQVIAHFKTEVGGFYIIHPDNEQEFNYEVRFKKATNRGFVAIPARITLTGSSIYGEKKAFQLYSNEIIPSNIIKRVTFVYDKQGDERPKWRVVDVTGEDDQDLWGIEDGKLKHFKKAKILGGKILPA